jgi:hypothetical protein
MTLVPTQRWHPLNHSVIKQTRRPIRTKVDEKNIALVGTLDTKKNFHVKDLIERNNYQEIPSCGHGMAKKLSH